MSDAPLTAESEALLHDYMAEVADHRRLDDSKFRHDIDLDLAFLGNVEPQFRSRLAAIESAARAAEAERLRALYMATVAGEYCNIDVFHDHVHQGCNARCWCSWADPEHCPLDAAGAPR